MPVEKDDSVAPRFHVTIGCLGVCRRVKDEPILATEVISNDASRDLVRSACVERRFLQDEPGAEVPPLVSEFACANQGRTGERRLVVEHVTRAE